MTAGEVIEIVEDLEPSVYSDETLLMFINELEMKLRRKVERSTAYITFKREVDQKEYNMYSLTGMLDDKYNSERMDFNFSNIMSVLINGEKINHVGLDHDESLPGYRMAQNTNLELFPVVTSEPSEDDVKVIFLAPGNALDMEIDYLTELVGSEFKEMYYLYVIAKINF